MFFVGFVCVCFGLFSVCYQSGVLFCFTLEIAQMRKSLQALSSSEFAICIFLNLLLAQSIQSQSQHSADCLSVPVSPALTFNCKLHGD